ncbi:hypothetical protein FB451DRAFT_1410211 [Mycena latifolia]|nr:hypothetical protein FB451DRAFT_1410211 [Mycena latifolia]
MPAHHIAAMLIPSWGHTVSYIYIATQMLQKDPTLVISMVQHNMEAELKTLTYDAARLRIIGLGDKDMSMQFSPAMIKEAFGQLMSGWMQTLPLLAQGSEEWPKPHAIHIDFFSGGFVIEPTKKIMGPDCKMLLWLSCSLASMPAYLTDYDFAAIAQEIYNDDAGRQGRSMEDILEQVHLAWNGSDKLSGTIIKAPGVPDMYDYERITHATGPVRGIVPILVSAQKFAKVADGILVPTSTCLEPVGVQHCREFHQKRGQELFTVGVQTHELCWSDAPSAGPTNEVVRSFLDNATAQSGPKSVLYISFGSVWFPVATPQLIEALVDTLLALETPFPFVFALGGRMASLPDELIERVNSSGRGLICKFWVEQRAILQHAAVGWFLTHGGWNSISESLCQGVPLIVWPTNAEQPVNAALLSSGPNPVAIELIQVRTGTQLAPSLRGGPKITGTVEDASAEFKAVFEDARGAKGAILIGNAAKMAAALREARAGEASDELVRLARF